jgi:drug/metabolite transporter (DMT)-like permease
MPFLGELSALITALLWSVGSYAFTHAVENIGSVQLNMNRLMLAAVLLFLTIVIFNFNYDLSYNQLLNLSISGIIGLVIGDLFLFKAYSQIGARLTILLMSFAPVLSALMAFFFLSERISFVGITGMVITVVGILLVVSERNKSPEAKYKMTPWGFFNGFMAAAGQAGGLIFAKLAFDRGEINGFVATFVRIFTSVIILLIVLVIVRQFKNPVKTYRHNGKALLTTFIGTVCGPFLGVTFSLIAVEYTKVGIAATLISTMPVIMLPISKYYFKDKLSWRSITGAFIAVVGIAILFLR